MTNVEPEWESLLTSAHSWWTSPDLYVPDRLERRSLGWLTAPEQARRLEFRTEALRLQYLVTRALCRGVLSRYAAVEPGVWRFGAGSHGKPVIVEPQGYESLRFNLAHTAGMVVCLVSRAGEVGVDIEATTRVVDFSRIVSQFLSMDEQARVMQMPEDQRRIRCYELWVLKEAYLKGRGTGLSDPPDGFSIPWANDRPLPLNGWTLSLHRPTADHIAATAVQGAAEVVWREMEL